VSANMPSLALLLLLATCIRAIPDESVWGLHIPSLAVTNLSERAVLDAVEVASRTIDPSGRGVRVVTETSGRDIRGWRFSKELSGQTLRDAVRVILGENLFFAQDVVFTVTRPLRPDCRTAAVFGRCLDKKTGDPVHGVRLSVRLTALECDKEGVLESDDGRFIGYVTYTVSRPSLPGVGDIYERESDWITVDVNAPGYEPEKVRLYVGDRELGKAQTVFDVKLTRKLAPAGEHEDGK
jgi:hypothetical protein